MNADLRALAELLARAAYDKLREQRAQAQRPAAPVVPPERPAA